MTPLIDAVSAYLEHIKYERRLAALTCEQYQSHLRAFNRWCANNGYGPVPTLDAFNPDVLRRYQIDRTKDGLRPRALHGLFHPLRGLALFLIERGDITDDPTTKIKLPPKDAAVRHLLSDDDVKALFDGCTRLRTTREIALAKAVLSVLAYGALRREELCSLHLSDIDLSDGAILVRSGKGSKSRRVFICREGVAALREWLALRESDCQLDYLFMLDRRRRLHLTGIASLMDAIAAAAGMRDNPACKPHSVRHWAASNLLKNGGSLANVQKYLGHSDIVTTSRYLHSSEEELRKLRELTAIKTPTPITTKPEQNDRPALRVVSTRDERPRQRRAMR